MADAKGGHDVEEIKAIMVRVGGPCRKGHWSRQLYSLFAFEAPSTFLFIRMSEMGQSRPRLAALAPPDVRYASISNQSFAAPRLVATGQ